MPDTAHVTCRECGFHSEADARFCEKCGASLRDRCPRCNGKVRADQRFCGGCGESLAAHEPSRAALLTPDHLVERILPSVAERKTATVLFADIANSTDVVANCDAEEARQFLVPALDLMADAVHRYEGIVVRDRGDGIMASFGAPVALEDHAARACYAALDMQKAINARSDKMQRELGLPLKVRIGINSGVVLVTVKYEPLAQVREIRLDGVTTHIAARLETLASPGQTLLGADAAGLAEPFVRTRALGPHALRGVPHPVEVHALETVRTRKRVHGLAARPLSKFVGRRHEVASLRERAAQAKEGHGQVVAMIGEAGVGKSRVFHEFLQTPAIKRWLVLEAGSVSYGKATSYLPLLDLLTRYFDVDDADSAVDVENKIRAKLATFGDEKLITQAPFLVGILGRAPEHEAWEVSPAERQRSMFDALKRLFIHEANRQPLCVVFEDLHWIDAETQAFLDLLVESVPALPLLLLVNYRDDYRSRWMSKSCFSQLRLDPLPPLSATELLDDLLGAAPQLDALKRQLVEGSEGNPLFLEECVRSLIETRVLAGGTGAWTLQGQIPPDFVPRSIEVLLGARIDRLDPKPKELLQCAAVVGNDISRYVLAQMIDGDHDVETELRELQAAEFLYEKTLLPEPTYTFKHAMTREVAYGCLVSERKTTLHARAARAMLASPLALIDDQVERLAQHAERGALWDVALEYLQRAGAKAYALYANTEAAGYFERAIEALKRLPSTRATLQLAIDLRFELRNALIALCELDRISRCLDELEPLLVDLGSKERLARHAAFRCNHHCLAGEQLRAIGFAESGLELAKEIGDLPLQGELLYRIGQCCHALGDYGRAVEVLEQSMQCTVTQFGHDQLNLSVIPAAVNRVWLTLVLTQRGDFATALMHAKRSLAIAEQNGHALSQVLGWFAIGHVLHRKGELDGAIGAFERGLDLCSRFALPIWRLRLLSSVGLAYAQRGRPVEGLEAARDAAAAAERMQLVVDQPTFLAQLAGACYFANRADEAYALAIQAAEIASDHAAKGDEAWARFAAGVALLGGAHASPDRARTELERALELASECEAQPLIAHCRDVLSRILAAAGEHAPATELAALARAAYAELDLRPFDFAARRDYSGAASRS